MKFFKKEKLIMIFAIAVLLLSGFNFSYAATPVYGGPDVSLTDLGHQYSVKQNPDNTYVATDMATGSSYNITLQEFQILDEAGQIKNYTDSKNQNATGGLGDAGTVTAPKFASSDNEGACVSGRVFIGIDIYNCIKQLLYIILWLVSFVVSIFGWVFNVVFDKTVRNIADTIKDMVIIKQGWTVVRDLCNIGFIFILLWLSISTILGLNEHGVKHALSRVIIAAVLINFSLMFTQMVIDIPNMLSVTIYDKTVQCADGDWSCGLGSAVFNVINPEEKVSGAGALEGSVNGAPNNPTSNTAFPNDAQRQQFARNGGITTFVMMLILYSTTLFVFLASIIIFIKRFIILLFLMIFSPLAYLGMAVPIHSLQHEAEHKFWNTLVKEAFYAPIFMLCVNVSLNVGQALFKNNANGGFGETVFGFSVVIIMMIASLLIAEEMGVSGAGGAMTAFQGMSQGAASWVGTNTVGRVASTLINKTDRGDQLRDMAAGKYGKNIITRTLSTAVGRGIVGTADKLGSSFDNKVKKDNEWMQAAIDNRHGDHEFTAQMFSKAAGDNMFSADRKTLDNQFHHMSLDQKANMFEELKDMAKDNSKDSHGHDYNNSDREGAKKALERFYGWNHAAQAVTGHGRLESDEAVELPRKIASGTTHSDNQLKHALDHDDDAKVESFFKNATEGQLRSAIRAVGSTNLANKFSTNDRFGKSLINGLMRFQGESMISSITKDDILNPSIKELASQSMFKRKVLWDTFSLLKNNEDKAGAHELAKTIIDSADSLPEISTEISAYSAPNGQTEQNLKNLVHSFEDKYSKMESSAKYTINGNGERTLIKSQNSNEEIKKAYTSMQKFLDDNNGNVKADVVERPLIKISTPVVNNP